MELNFKYHSYIDKSWNKEIFLSNVLFLKIAYTPKYAQKAKQYSNKCALETSRILSRIKRLSVPLYNPVPGTRWGWKEGWGFIGAKWLHISVKRVVTSFMTFPLILSIFHRESTAVVVAGSGARSWQKFKNFPPKCWKIVGIVS